MINKYIVGYIKEGYSFFNTGSVDKKIKTFWTKYKTEKPSLKDIDAWSKWSCQNYAIVCGEISNLIVIDVDTKNGADPKPFFNRGMREIKTPSGGYHFYIKYNPLLSKVHHKGANGKGILKYVDLQTNGTCIFAAPSFFPGKGGYEVLNDVPVSNIPDDLLAEILHCLEPEKQSTDYKPYIGPQDPLLGRPGDIFNTMATWDDVLIPLGWTKVGYDYNGKQFWRRPGKRDGISASTNWNGYNLFFCYSSSVDNIETNKGYSKFSLLTALKYDGDYKKAAKALVLENHRIINNLV